MDTESSKMTTFDNNFQCYCNTPFVSLSDSDIDIIVYRKPDIFKITIHVLMKGLTWVEVIADDFLMFEPGKTTEQSKGIMIITY